MRISKGWKASGSYVRSDRARLTNNSFEPTRRAGPNPVVPFLLSSYRTEGVLPRPAERLNPRPLGGSIGEEAL
jgi:hypothetical protein